MIRGLFEGCINDGALAITAVLSSKKIGVNKCARGYSQRSLAVSSARQNFIGSTLAVGIKSAPRYFVGRLYFAVESAAGVAVAAAAAAAAVVPFIRLPFAQSLPLFSPNLKNKFPDLPLLSPVHTRKAK